MIPFNGNVPKDCSINFEMSRNTSHECWFLAVQVLASTARARVLPRP